jgi:hypothetical protein
LRLYYRGYGAALKFVEQTKKWLPVVFELTERLEHDMNGVWSRGQVWEISKERDTKETRGKVTGVLKNQLDPQMIPPPVNIEPVLKALFRVECLPWGAVNNVPKAVAVSFVEIDQRADPARRSGEQAEEQKRPSAFSQEIIDELAKRSRMPKETSNGKAH